MKHHIFLKVLSLFLCWSFSARESSAQEERGLQGKIIDNVYVVESFKLDTSTLGIQERKQYQKQLISLKRNVKPKSNFESRIEPPQEIKYENQVFRHVNNYCYEPSNKVVDYLVAELYPNVLEYRQNKNQINPGRSQKIVLYDKFDKIAKTIWIDKINPYKNFKNLKWGGIDYADTHKYAKKESTKDVENYNIRSGANNYIFNCSSHVDNGCLFIRYHLYPLNENKVLGEETTVFIYDLKGGLLHKKVYQKEVVQISISKDKKNIIAFYGSVSGKPLEMGALGAIEVYNIDKKKIIFLEEGTKEWIITGFSSFETDLCFIDREWAGKNGKRLFKFIDLDSYTLYEKEFAAEDFKKLPQVKLTAAELLQYTLFNQKNFNHE